METTDYQQQAIDFLNATNTSFKATFKKYDRYFPDDKERRDIYRITLKNDLHRYSFLFGQSIANQGQAPTPYDVLACLTKYNPYSFEDFCAYFGYDYDSQAEKIYNAVCKEWDNINKLFTSEQIEQLQEIQ